LAVYRLPVIVINIVFTNFLCEPANYSKLLFNWSCLLNQLISNNFRLVMRFWRTKDWFRNLRLDSFSKIKLLLFLVNVLDFNFPLSRLSRWSIFLSFDFFISILPLNLRRDFRYSYCHYSRSWHYSKLIGQYFHFFIHIKFKHWCKLSRMIWVNHGVIFLWIQILYVVVLIKKFTCLINLVNNSLNSFWIHVLFHSLNFIDE